VKTDDPRLEESRKKLFERVPSMKPQGFPVSSGD